MARPNAIKKPVKSPAGWDKPTGREVASEIGEARLLSCDFHVSVFTGGLHDRKSARRGRRRCLHVRCNRVQRRPLARPAMARIAIRRQAKASLHNSTGPASASAACVWSLGSNVANTQSRDGRPAATRIRGCSESRDSSRHPGTTSLNPAERELTGLALFMRLYSPRRGARAPCRSIERSGCRYDPAQTSSPSRT